MFFKNFININNNIIKLNVDNKKSNVRYKIIIFIFIFLIINDCFVIYLLRIINEKFLIYKRCRIC